MQFPTVDPTTYKSPSGAFALVVDPSQPGGAGKATYRLTRRGTVIWEGERPFTLWGAGVADDGTVGGWAYSNGLMSWATRSNDYGTLTLHLLDPTGKTRLRRSFPRTYRPLPEHPPVPQVTEFVFDPGNDRMWMGIYEAKTRRGEEDW